MSVNDDIVAVVDDDDKHSADDDYDIFSVNAAFRCYSCTSSTEKPNRQCEDDHFNTSVVGDKDCSMTGICTKVTRSDCKLSFT